MALGFPDYDGPSMGDFLDLVWFWIVSVAQAIWSWIVWLANNLWLVAQWVLDIAHRAFHGLRYLASGLWQALRALGHLKFGQIWGAIKRGYERFLSYLEWINRKLLEPIDRLRRQILEIYRKFFQPIIRLIDSFRVMVRIIALFNKKLAARLDARLLSLEAKILAPIIYMLHRVNELSSQARAWVTALGYLDRGLLLESLRRDALLAWEVLTNPLGRLYEKRPPVQRKGTAQLGREFADYIHAQTGPVAVQVERDVDLWQTIKTEAEI